MKPVRRILSLALAALLLCAVPLPARAAQLNHANAAEPTKTNDPAGFYVFANGTPVIIREVAGKTLMFKASAPDTPLFGGENLDGLSIFGGFSTGDYVGDTCVVIEGGKFNYCYGGNRLGSVTGSTNFIVNGGTFTNLYGGGMSSMTYGTTNVTFNGGVCKGDVYGGNYITGSVQGDAVIHLKGGDFSGRTICGGGIQYNAGGVSGDSTVNVYPAANVTDVAFSGNGVGGTFTVNYFTGLLLQANGGAGSMTAPPFHLGGGSFTVPANTFTAPAGSSGFLAWNTAADGSGTSYQPGDTIHIANAVNVKLYAQWGAAPGSAETWGYTFYHTPGLPPVISFIEKGGVFQLSGISNALTGTRPGRVLRGWSLTYGAMQVDFPPNGTVNLQRDAIFFAVWAYTDRVAVEPADAFNPDVEMRVSGEDPNFQIGPGKSVHAAYDIKFIVDGQTVQPNGKVTVRLPLEDLSPSANANWNVYYIARGADGKPTGELVNMNARVEPDPKDDPVGPYYAVFETDHFSTFAFASAGGNQQQNTDKDCFRLWGRTTRWEKKPLNWFLYIVCFGWIWMAF